MFVNLKILGHNFRFRLIVRKWLVRTRDPYSRDFAPRFLKTPEKYRVYGYRTCQQW